MGENEDDAGTIHVLNSVYEQDIGKVVDDIKNIKSEIKDLYDLVSEQNDVVEMLSRANIDLINIDMQLISTELYNAEMRLNSIATVEQFDFLRDVEKTTGLNMAYNKSKIFLEGAGSEAKMVIPTLNLIKLTLDKISEKLKYCAEA